MFLFILVFQLHLLHDAYEGLGFQFGGAILLHKTTEVIKQNFYFT